MNKIWILAQVDYDEYTIIGVYTSAEGAEAARQMIEKAIAEHTTPRERHRSRSEERQHLSIEEYETDRTGLEIIVRIRKDGELAETHVIVGYSSINHSYEKLFEGRAETFESARALAERARST